MQVEMPVRGVRAEVEPCAAVATARYFETVSCISLLCPCQWGWLCMPFLSLDGVAAEPQQAQASISTCCPLHVYPLVFAVLCMPAVCCAADLPSGGLLCFLTVQNFDNRLAADGPHCSHMRTPYSEGSRSGHCQMGTQSFTRAV